jgi:hypothetical protein
MQGQDNIVSFGGGLSRQKNTVLDVRGQRVVADARKLLSSSLPKLLAGLFEQLDDSLYDMADRSGSNAVQSTYFDAMRILRKQRQFIEQEFSQQVLRAYDRFWETGLCEVASGQAPGGLARSTELSLLDDDELEDSLAITNMISKSENRYTRELYALGQRFFHLASGGKGQIQDNARSPLEPAVICHGFQAAMRDIPVELPVKLVVYKQFEKHVIHYLGGLYDEVNLLFGRMGVIPNLTPRVRRNPVAPALARGGAAESGLVNESSMLTSEMVGAEESSVQSEVFSTLQQLLGRVRVAGESRLVSSVPLHGGSGLRLPAVDTLELLGALSAMQQSNMLFASSLDEGQLTPQELRLRLVDDLRLREGSEPRRALGDADNDTIDVVTMMFEFILDDFSLPDAIKTLLSRLQIPMLKVAVIDKSFFSQQVHPARRLLNRLAQAAVGWNDNGERQNDSLYHKIEGVVKRILNDFHDDPAIFAELDAEFAAWWEQEQRMADMAEQRTNQVTRGKEQLRSAKRVVMKELNRRLQGVSSLPEAVMELLEEGWKDVLLLNYLRQGPDSEEWKESLAIVDRLLWSVQPKSEYAQRQELLRSIPELLRSLRERLNSISFDQHKMARIFKGLQNCHIGCLRGDGAASMKGVGTLDSRHSQINFPDSQIVTGKTGREVDEAIDASLLDKDEFSRQADTIQVGTWIEVVEGDSKSRVKLSWKSNVTDAFIFVNRKGMKTMETTREGLAKMLREERAMIVSQDEAPIIDRALKALLDSLKNTAPAAPTA